MQATPWQLPRASINTVERPSTAVIVDGPVRERTANNRLVVLGKFFTFRLVPVVGSGVFPDRGFVQLLIQPIRRMEQHAQQLAAFGDYSSSQAPLLTATVVEE